MRAHTHTHTHTHAHTHTCTHTHTHTSIYLPGSSPVGFPARMEEVFGGEVIAVGGVVGMEIGIPMLLQRSLPQKHLRLPLLLVIAQ